MTAGTSPPSGSARETFLNYFFGQNGPGPIAGSSVDRAGHHSGQGHSHGHGHSHMNSQSIGSTEPTHIVPVGRDVSGGESALSSGLMAGKRSIDGNNAAYDMKSLGRHIEAVSEIFFIEVRTCHIFCDILAKFSSLSSFWTYKYSFLDPSRWWPTDDARRNGNATYPISHSVVLQYCSTKHPGYRPKSHHALPGQPHFATGTEPSRRRTIQAGAVCRHAQ